MKYIKIFTTFLIILIIAGKINTAYAQQVDNSAFSIKITPNNNNIALNPGDSISLNLYIQNLSKTDITAWIYTRDFIPTDNKGDIRIYSDSDLNAGTGSWITFQNIFSQDQIYTDSTGKITFKQVITSQAKGSGYISLSPNQQFTLPYTIQVPKDAYFGTHNTIIFVQPIINPTSSTSGSTIEGRVGSNLLIDIGQHTNNNLTIKSINLKQNSIFSAPSINIDIRNNSDYVNFTKSSLTLSGLFTSVKTNLDPITVLSHSDRLVNYKGKSDIVLDSLSNLFFIKYTANIAVNDTTTGKILTKSISFIYINPFVAILASFILIEMLFLIFRKFTKK